MLIFPDPIDDRPEHRRRRRAVIQAAPLGSPFTIELVQMIVQWVEGAGVVECPEPIRQGIGERLPGFVFQGGSAELLDRSFYFLPEALVVPFGSRVPHDRVSLWAHP